MTTLPSVTRHYPKVKGLVRRTKADLSPEFLEARTLATPSLREMMQAKPAHPSLVSTAHGAFSKLLLTIPAYAVEAPGPGEENPLAIAYQDLLQKLPAQVELIVLTHEAVQDQVDSWLKTAKLDTKALVVGAPDDVNFSVWAEDGYVVIGDQESGKSYFVEPYTFPRYGDALIADFVANASDLRDTQAPLYFQGGNVLVGDDFFMIGADYPAKSLAYINQVILPKPNEAPADAVRRLYGEYLDPSRKLIYVGSTIPVPAEKRESFTQNGERWHEDKYVGNSKGTTQPLFHIDMFLTLAGRNAEGKYQILVGDPRMAAKILGWPVQRHSIPEVFDNIARGFSRIGFEVIRNPLPLVYVDDPESRVRTWYFATSNNALVEIAAEGAKTVWLPTYGHGNWSTLEATDRCNREIWEGLGFEVKMLVDYHPFAEELGSVHCIKKYLKREVIAATT
jgi:hypothetical protein